MLASLYRVLNDWFPGVAQLAQAQAWKGARPMLPDGPPLVGASGREGLWLNLGHGDGGWSLAAGSARVLADLIARRQPAIDTAGLSPARLN
jgi:D-amino-acid dehydrogenase